MLEAEKSRAWGSNLLKEELKTECYLVFIQEGLEENGERIYPLFCVLVTACICKNQVHVIIYKIIKSTSLPRHFNTFEA